MASASQNVTTKPHRRYNPLKDEWIIVSPHRITRPWQGQTEADSCGEKTAVDLNNPLLPGATRASGKKNDMYTSTYVFENDFSALRDDSTPDSQESGVLFQSDHARGTCKVICYHPRSDVQIATMAHEDIVTVIREWIKQFNDLCSKYDWVQIFENKGAIMGCSNPHPHCQIWSCGYLPHEAATKDRTQNAYMEKYGAPMLLDYAKQEMTRKVRIVVENSDWLVVVPYWAVWPFETMLLSKRHVLRLNDLTDSEISSLAEIMKNLLVRYDNLFKCQFPYSMGWHGAPSGGYLSKDNNHWQLHAVWLPPLLRSATVKKFMAGFELLCEPQRDLTPESAADILRRQDEVHYTAKR